MESKSWYPRDFQQALNNTLSDDDVTSLLKAPNCSPRFVYGILMLPTVLKYFLNVDQTVGIDRRMTHATLPGYKLYQFSSTSTPVMVPSSDPQTAVEGMLVFGLNEHHRNAVYEIEGGLMNLVNVQVQIYQRDQTDAHEVWSVRSVDAGAFSWQGSREGLIGLRTTFWSLDDFLTSSFYEYIAQSQHRHLLAQSPASSQEHQIAVALLEHL